MKQHDEDAAPPQGPRSRRRAAAPRPAWPFPSGSVTPPQGDTNDPEADLADTTRPHADPDTTHTIPQRRKP